MKKYSNFVAVFGISEKELREVLDKGAFVASYLVTMEGMEQDVVPEKGFLVVSSTEDSEIVVNKILNIQDFVSKNTKAFGLAVVNGLGSKLLFVDLKKVDDMQQTRSLIEDSLNQIPCIPTCIVREGRVHEDVCLQLCYLFDDDEEAAFFEESAEVIKNIFPGAEFEARDCGILYFNGDE